MRNRLLRSINESLLTQTAPREALRHTQLEANLNAECDQQAKITVNC